jgi:hypothetical protein
MNALRSSLVIWHGHSYFVVEAACAAESRI